MQRDYSIKKQAYFVGLLLLVLAFFAIKSRIAGPTETEEAVTGTRLPADSESASLQTGEAETQTGQPAVLSAKAVTETGLQKDEAVVSEEERLKIEAIRGELKAARELFADLSGEPLDYTDPDHWLVIPEIMKEVDTVYIYDTTCADEKKPDILPADSKVMQRGA